MESVAVVIAMMATMDTMAPSAMAAMAAALSESNARSEHDQGGSKSKSSFTEHFAFSCEAFHALSVAPNSKGVHRNKRLRSRIDHLVMANRFLQCAVRS
jgi:hypothetical protein